VDYIEAYLKLKNPTRTYEFINCGLPSETVSGLSEEGHAGGQFPRPDLHERLQRVLIQTRPDLVFACYGMNDGIYLPLDPERFEKFKSGIYRLHETVIKSGANIIHLTPPIYDEKKGEAYANVLDFYSDWLISCRHTNNWNVIDIHWPMKKFLEDKRLSDTAYYLAKDGVHPGKTGHWIIARQVLHLLGETEALKYETVDEAMTSFSSGKEILKLIEARAEIMKDAWLNSTGHIRPGMKTGLPLNEAYAKVAETDAQIKIILHP
jgi:lysophospholipase L1-like esterase